MEFEYSEFSNDIEDKQFQKRMKKENVIIY